MLVHGLEMSDPTGLEMAGAEIRSVWEDLQQQRRNLLAGKISGKLEKSSDETRPRLLKAEEEKRISIAQSKARSSRPQTSYFLE